MGSENLNAIEEIKALGHQVDLAGDLADLEPIRRRLDELAVAHAGDPEVQKAADETRRLVASRAARLTPSQYQPPPVPPDFGPASVGTAPPTIPHPGVIPTLPATPVPEVRQPMEWQRALWTGVLAGVALSVVLIVILVNVARRRNVSLADLAVNDVPVQISTTPPGASIRVNGETKCVADCRISLAPGAYQITAFLEGYEPAASGINLVLGKPETLNLNLEARPQTVRIFSDLAKGKVTLDQQAAVDLQDGQYVFENVAPGNHTVSVSGSGADASFSFELGPAKLPAVSGTVTTHNVLAMIVTSFAGHARLVTSSGPWKLTVNGQSEDNAGPAGVDLKNFQAGLDELVISQGNDQRSLKEDFGPGPALTAFLKTDRNVGTLLVLTGENNVRVFVNDKEYPRRTQNGQLRIQAIGPVEVRVAKNGFENSPVQSAEVKKGGEARLEFKMKPLPQLSSLRIEGATPGAEVLLDQAKVGTISDDGSFRDAAVPPGDHVILIRRDRFSPKQFSRTFAAGQTVTIGGSDAALIAERAPTPPPPPPPEPKPEPVVTKAPPRAMAMDGFENLEGWMQQDNGIWRRRGGGFVLYKTPGAGTFTYAVYMIRGGSLFRGGRVRWVTDYKDSKNYIVSELDENNLAIKDVVNGKTSDHAKLKHNVESKDKAWAIQIEIAPDRLIHRIQKDKEWITLDTLNSPEHKFSEGRFGFMVQGNDEIGVSDFKFQPAR